MNGGSGSVSFGLNTATLTGDGTNAAGIYQAITTVAGYTYTVAVTTGAGNSVTVEAGTAATGSSAYNLLAATSQAVSSTSYYQFTASGTTSYVQIYNTSATAGTVTTVSVQSAGQAPTDWSVIGHIAQQFLGVAVKDLGMVTVNGVPCLQLTYSGTAISSGYLQLLFDTSNVTGLGVSASFAQSLYAQIVSGSVANTSFVNRDFVYDSGNNQVAGGINQVVTLSGSLNRLVGTGTTPSSGNSPFLITAPSFLVFVTAGNSYNFTLNIGMPQLELGAFPTSVIPTFGSAVTRATDMFSVPVTAAGSNGAWLTQGIGTLICNGIQAYNYVSGNPPRWWSIDDGSVGQANFQSIAITPSLAQQMTYGGSGTYNSPSFTNSAGVTTKSALAWTNGSVNSAVNATLGTPNTTTSIPTTVTALGIGSNSYLVRPLNGWISRLTYFPTRQPDASLADYTR